MKLSKKQVIIIVSVALFVGIIIGIISFNCVHNCPEPPPADNTLIDSLRIENAIKDGKIQIRDLIIKANDEKQFAHDSIIINNHKDLKNNYEKIKDLDADSRAAYIDSVLKRTGIRHR